MTHGSNWPRRAALVTTAVVAGGALATAGFATSGSFGLATTPDTVTVSADPDTAVRDALESLTGVDAGGQGVADGADKYTARDVNVAADGSRHVRFDRTYKGLPVLGGSVVVNSGRDGQFGKAQGTAISVDTTPKIDAAQAASAVAAKWSKLTVGAAPVLAVDVLDGAPALVWEVKADGTAADGTPSKGKIRVSAATGAVLGASSSVRTLTAPGTKTAAGAAQAAAAGPVAGNGKGLLVGNVAIDVNQKADGTYELLDPTRGGQETRDANGKGDGRGALPKAQTTAFSSATSTFGNNALSNRATAAVDAHYGVAQTWDYFKNVHNRSGINNQGTGALSVVHYGNAYQNAFWDDDCYCMSYGDGASNTHPLTELDVAGHEMAHGVTFATANLDYGNPDLGIFKESGGLNEATSDIFGTLVEFRANMAVDTPDYLIGEEIDYFGNGKPLRYLDDPAKDGRSFNCWNAQMGTTQDPHLTSGVGNHLFFIAAVGSGARTVNGVNYNSPVCNNAPAVNGLGNDKFGKIWYRALTSYMVSTETYPKARISTLKATNDLYGAAECTTMKAAWTAVGVVAQAGEPACAANPTPTATATPTVKPTATPTVQPTVQPTGGTCTAAQKVTNGTFETGTAPWTGDTGVIQAGTSAQPAHGGTRMAWLGGNGRAVTESLSQQISIPAGCKASLKFYLHIDTAETGTTVYDKFTVFAGSTALGSYSNVNKAAGYTLRTFDLSNYAGQTVTLKFSETEDSYLKTSFVLDDVTVTLS
ncbi:M4 family metallopeptidase [Longispora sp. NPDC051575]|uniref:M4 family metallopeptidase n=1 Tax=Longispora sp. NPDC051575 TaxID=3154943 RepID=UPI003419BB83